MLSAIVIATMVPALCAALVISLIPPTILSRMGKALSLIATGLLLTLALTHLLPEAIEGGKDIHDIGLTIWITIMVLIALEMFFNSNHHSTTCPVCTTTHHSSSCHICLGTNKLGNITNIRPLNLNSQDLNNSLLYPHHRTNDTDNRSTLHHIGHSHLFSLKASDIKNATLRAKENEALGTKSIKESLSKGGGPILAGSLFHSLCDGIVIASSFMVDFNVGMAVTAAIIAHELPQQVSNYVLMLNFGMTRIQGYIVNLVALFGSLTGGIIFYNILDKAQAILPFALAVSGGSFIYVALSDILPRINKPDNKIGMVISFSYLLLGAAIAMLLSHHH